MTTRKPWQRCRKHKRRHRDYRLLRKMRKENYRRLRREGVPVQDVLRHVDEPTLGHHPTR